MKIVWSNSEVLNLKNISEISRENQNNTSVTKQCKNCLSEYQKKSCTELKKKLQQANVTVAKDYEIITPLKKNMWNYHYHYTGSNISFEHACKINLTSSAFILKLASFFTYHPTLGGKCGFWVTAKCIWITPELSTF